MTASRAESAIGAAAYVGWRKLYDAIVQCASDAALRAYCAEGAECPTDFGEAVADKVIARISGSETRNCVTCKVPFTAGGPFGLRSDAVFCSHKCSVRANNARRSATRKAARVAKAGAK